MKFQAVGVVPVVIFSAALAGTAAAQQVAPLAAGTARAATPAGAALPAGYVIGPEDVLSVVFWREKDWSADVVVRPDGKISLPVLNDVQAAGFTPEQLGSAVEEAARKYIVGAEATVIVKEIHSRKVYVVGEVGKPGPFPLGGEMTVLQAIANAGGLLEHANRGDIVIVRKTAGAERRFKFNYNDVLKGKKAEQNIALQPGDTILVR
jgi:polysaccharide export outer membrane protein